MVRTIIKPDRKNISIDLPESYIGRNVEVIVFAIEDPNDELNTNTKPLTHLASEIVLSKDWLTPEEDKAWANL